MYVITIVYCCSKCGKCYRKNQLKTKTIKEEGEIILELNCPKCGAVIAREIVLVKQFENM